MDSPKYTAKSKGLTLCNKSQTCKCWPLALELSKSSVLSQTNLGVRDNLTSFTQVHLETLEALKNNQQARHWHVDKSLKTHTHIRILPQKPSNNCKEILCDHVSWQDEICYEKDIAFITPDGILGVRTFGLCVNTIVLHGSHIYTESKTYRSISF